MRSAAARTSESVGRSVVVVMGSLRSSVSWRLLVVVIDSFSPALPSLRARRGEGRFSLSRKVQRSVEDRHGATAHFDARDPLAGHAQADVDEALATHPGPLLAQYAHLRGGRDEAMLHEIGAERAAGATGPGSSGMPIRSAPNMR